MKSTILFIGLIASSALAAGNPKKILASPLINLKAPNGFGISKSVITQYKSGPQHEGGHVMNVAMEMATHGVSTTDQGAIEHLACHNNSISLTVPDSNHYRTALTWKTPMTLLVTHDFECFGRNTNRLYLVESVHPLNGQGSLSKRDLNNQVRLVVKRAKFKDHISDIKINMNYQNQSASHLYRKRDLSSFEKRYLVTNNGDFGLNANSDGDGEAKLKNSVIYEANDEPTTEVLCEKCYTEGKATSNLNFDASILTAQVREANVGLKGDLLLNSDFRVQAKGGFINIGTTYLPLWSIPLSPFWVPGIINFGPSVKLMASVDLQLQAKGGLVLGAAMKFQDFTAAVDLIDGSKNEGKNFLPNIDLHKPNLEFTSNFKGEFNLMPTIVFEMNILNGWYAAEAGFGISGSLGLSNEKDKSCPSNGSRLSVFVTGSVAFVFGVLKEVVTKPFINFPRKDIWNTCTLIGSGDPEQGSDGSSGKGRPGSKSSPGYQDGGGYQTGGGGGGVEGQSGYQSGWSEETGNYNPYNIMNTGRGNNQNYPDKSDPYHYSHAYPSAPSETYMYNEGDYDYESDYDYDYPRYNPLYGR